MRRNKKRSNGLRNNLRKKPGLTKKIKNAYSSSVRNVSSHPYISLGTLTVGAGLLSALYLFKRNH